MFEEASRWDTQTPTNNPREGAQERQRQGRKMKENFKKVVIFLRVMQIWNKNKTQPKEKHSEEKKVLLKIKIKIAEMNMECRIKRQRDEK